MRVGFLSLLTVMFIGLKLAEVITWSWFWVVAPLLIPMMFIFGGPLLIWCILWVFFKLVTQVQYLKYKWRSRNER